MALVLKDRVKETTSTAGTGTVTLDGAVAGFQSFSAVGNGNSTYYAIVDSGSGDWEVGIGTYTSSGTTLSRTTVLSSSNAGSLVTFGAGNKDVFVTYPSERGVWMDSAGTALVQYEFNTANITTANISTANITAGTVSTTPASNTDIANKQYVDGLVTQGISYHDPVYVESPNTAGNLTATYNNGSSGVGATLTNAGTQVALTVDGILMTVGKRVLIYNQTNQFENGVYEVTTVGDGSTNWVLTRTADADTYGLRDPNALGYNDAFFVTNGNTGAGETYVCTTSGVITFGTTAITFAQISAAQVYSAGTGLNLSPATTFNISNTGVTAATYGSASTVPVFAVNAQGQITSVTDTNIAISGSAVSGNISGQAGSVANSLTAGTYLTGTAYNGSAAQTWTVDATSANTASKVVARDSSGDFSAGTITAALSGNATTATTATNVAGGAANQIVYNTGSGATAFATAPTVSSSYLNWNGSAFAWSTITSGTVTSITAGTYLTGGTITTSGTIAVDATSANTASKVVARDASGNFSAGTITATLSGNASTATQVANNLTLAVSGTGLSGSATFNGSSAQTFTVTSNATNANTASTIVARDASGNFSAGTITATLSGNASTATSATSATSATTATTATTANALNTGNNYQVNSLGVGTAGSGTAGEIRATNNITAYYSDDRLKTRLGNIENALAKVKTLDTFYYEANETAQSLGYEAIREVGISAQQVQVVMPETVAPAPIDDKYLTVRYERLVPLLLAAIKELEAKVAALEAKG